MNQYEIKITRCEYGATVLQAKNEKEAIEKTYAAIEKGMVFWHSEEITDISPTLQPPIKEKQQDIER